VFWDASENIVFLDLVKRAARARVTVPGLEHVIFGPGVTAAPDKVTEPDHN
jgi:hypothetical protein